MTSKQSTTHGRVSRFAGLALLAILAVSGCSAGSSADSDSASSFDQTPAKSGGFADTPPEADIDAEAPQAGAANDSAQSAPAEVAPVAVQTAQVIRTGTIRLASDDATEARAKLQQVVNVHRGQIANENSTASEGKISTVDLEIRVAASDFAKVMSEIEGIGELTSSAISTEDVSTQIVDVDARVRAQEIGLRRIENLLRKATNMSDILRLETEATTRRSDLDALKSELAYLKDNSAQSTIFVTLTRNDAPAKPNKDDEPSGFLAGLGGSWNAMKGSAVVAATVAGALLPWALVFGILGLLVWLPLRRLTRTNRTPAPVDQVAGRQA